MLEIRKIREEELEKFLDMELKHTGGCETVEGIRARFRENPDLFFGCLDDDDNLIGGISGFMAGKRVVIKSIWVLPDFRRQGIGSRLLFFFESRARKKAPLISAAPIEGYAEHFYMKNGFRPTKLMLRVKPGNLPADYRDKRYRIVEERIDCDDYLVYVRIDRADQELKYTIGEELHAFDAAFIFEKGNVLY
ncbi:GNAT family N-acetyltransferase [Candidatus Woesearchaeota archaeon]|nr:GNAT family N-acetyltransferase [Candidatus Woesearchaeota archaeon]